MLLLQIYYRQGASAKLASGMGAQLGHGQAELGRGQTEAHTKDLLNDRG